MSAAFSPDGKRIVTASRDKTARLWDAETGKPIGEPLKGHDGCCVERGVQPRRQAHRHRVCGQDGAAVGHLSPTPRNLVSHAKAAVPRCLTPAQRKAFFLPPEPPAWCIEMEKWPYDTPAWKQWLADTRAGKNPPLPVNPK